MIRAVLPAKAVLVLFWTIQTLGVIINNALYARRSP